MFEKNFIDNKEEELKFKKLRSKLDEAISLGLNLDKENIIKFAIATNEESAIDSVEKSISDYNEREKIKNDNPIEWLKQEIYNYVAEHEGGNLSSYYHYEKQIKDLGDNPTIEQVESLRKTIMKH